MYEFYKHNGEFTEGFLGNPEDFNGIVFILKESNLKKKSDSDTVTEFWFKKVEHDLDGYCRELEQKFRKEIAQTRKTATKFINRFSEILRIVGLGDRESLKNSVFCNINPHGGGSNAGKEYADALSSATPENMLLYLATLKNEITIFTCTEIYSRLTSSSVFEIESISDGIEYEGRKPLECAQGKVNGTKVCVYAIYHHSASKKLITK